MGYLPRKLNHQGNAHNLETQTPEQHIALLAQAGCYCNMTLPGQAWGHNGEVTRGKRSLQLTQSLRTARDAKDTQPALSFNEQIGIRQQVQGQPHTDFVHSR